MGGLRFVPVGLCRGTGLPDRSCSTIRLTWPEYDRAVGGVHGPNDDSWVRLSRAVILVKLEQMTQYTWRIGGNLSGALRRDLHPQVPLATPGAPGPHVTTFCRDRYGFWSAQGADQRAMLGTIARGAGDTTHLAVRSVQVGLEREL